MTLVVHNTLTNKKETFEPLQPGKIGIYACGLTVYDVCHIGHGMQAIIYDVIRNYFEYLGNEVRYVRNYTDVDDKIINRANEMGVPALEHSENMIEESKKDLALLGVKPATVEPKVTDHIAEIIELIEKIIAEGGAYEAEGDVYFDICSFPEYGRLSNRNPNDMCSGARIEINPKKRNPLDFTLWKAAKPGEVSWPSPWGEGRPGWHIECSALSMKYLGGTFDIHGGGKDLIFPHHENELAQSCRGIPNEQFARYWIHNGLVTVEGRKMSKSFNNFLSIKDAVIQYYPETMRFTILSHHYSANIDFSDKSFYDAYHRLLYFYNTLERIDGLMEQFPDYPKTVPPEVEAPPVEEQFQTAMNDDFNTAAALVKLGEAFKFLNDLLAAKKPKLKQKTHVLCETAAAIRRCMKVLGLVDKKPATALKEIQQYLIKSRNIDMAWAEKLVAERETARQAKEWGRADEIRDQLSQAGIMVMDTPAGPKWQVQP